MHHFTTTEGVRAVASIEVLRGSAIGLVIREDRQDVTGWKAPLVMALPVAHVSPAILATVAGPEDVAALAALALAEQGA